MNQRAGRFRLPGRVPFGAARKEPKGGLGGVPPVRLRPQGQASLTVGPPPKNPRKGYGGVSSSAQLAFRRPKLAVAQLPPAASGLVHPYALAIAPHRGAWNGEALRHVRR